MPTPPLTLEAFPRAILHVDGDAFFTSVEQVIHPELKGKPVVTGKERGIIACASYEAKALGVRRGIMLSEARARCPSLVILPSDYETYSIFSKRIFNIMRRYSPIVEEYSIDEGFMDLSGAQRMHRASYREIAESLRSAVRAELGLTVSAGLSLTKTLAKLASDCRKPDGLTPVAGYHIHVLLMRTPVGEVWGIGPRSSDLLGHHGIQTAYDFILRPEAWVAQKLGKPGKDAWNELRGNMVHPVSTEMRASPLTVSKCRSFGAPSSDREYVRARILRNLESAFIKLRRLKLKTGALTLALRRDDFTQWGVEARFNRATASTLEAVPLAMDMWGQLFVEGEAYRTAVVVLGDLAEEGRGEQLGLFENPLKLIRLEQASAVADDVDRRYGKHTVMLGQTLCLDRHRVSVRDDPPWRKKALLPGETKRKRLRIPRLAIRI